MTPNDSRTQPDLTYQQKAKNNDGNSTTLNLPEGTTQTGINSTLQKTMDYDSTTLRVLSFYNGRTRKLR